MPWLVALTISLDACNIQAFKLFQQTILICHKLRVLKIDIQLLNRYLDDDRPRIHGFRLRPNEKLPPLKSLSLSGFHFESSEKKNGNWEDIIDFTNLTNLTLRDDAFPWWQEPRLNLLQSFKAKMPKQPKTPSTKSTYIVDFHCFFSQNKHLETLNLARLIEDFDFVWLKPIGSTLKTLHLHEFNRTSAFQSGRSLGHSDLRLLGKILPNVRELKLDLGASKTWPYEKLTTIALAFPELSYLTVHMNYPLDFRQAFPSSNEIDNYQFATISRTASSWSYLWICLSSNSCFPSERKTSQSVPSEEIHEQPTTQTTKNKRYKTISFPKMISRSLKKTSNTQEMNQQQQIHSFLPSQREPLLKSLVVVVGPPESPGSQSFHATISECAEDAKRGKAFVVSLDVEDTTRQMRELSARSIQSNQFGDMCQNLLQARRKAKEGFFNKDDKRPITSESWKWGAKLSVVPDQDAEAKQRMDIDKYWETLFPDL